MILFDTDHLSVLVASWHSQHGGLLARMDASADQEFVASVASLEEQLRAWLNKINQQRSVRDQVVPYAALSNIVEFYSRWNVLPFDLQAAEIFQDLRRRKVRIGTQDLKIASTAMANKAVLVTANTVDFAQVPGLQFEDWLH